MMQVWNNISYMVELLAACIVFLMPLRKKRGFILRAAGLSLFFILVAYYVNVKWNFLLFGGITFLYWATYFLFSLIFMWFCMEGTLLQALYYTIYVCTVQHVAYDIYLIYSILGGNNYFVCFMIFVCSYALAYFLVAVKLGHVERSVITKKSLFPIATIIILVWILSIMDDSFVSGFESGNLHRVIYRICDALCCIYVLWVQIGQKELMKLQSELIGINTAWRMQKEQYEMTGDTIENINRKCHDLKHQIRVLRTMEEGTEKEEYFKEIENDIMIYDTALQTGNKALDIVLMEKALFCKNHGISWTCMADGVKLDFMKMEDIYAIFGNALDNAVRAVMELDDQLKRVISVKIIIQNKILVIQIQNYYKGNLEFEKGLPVTTKKNKRDHGYGMKSILYTAEKYNGTITVSTEKDIFMLQVLIPIERGCRTN